MACDKHKRDIFMTSSRPWQHFDISDYIKVTSKHLRHLLDIINVELHSPIP